ncbi:MAG: ATP phosphoribosyltransferase regulatory subunit [Clostridia bacterium]|nr:ATP phosphoribosyltransferase regulatory subunit [Clostridia bacterium]
MDNKVLKNEEKAVFTLRSLYKKYGYLPFKMSKFEEYDLYVRNKDFLVSERVITFNDTNGRLLALKPDVTLSIIKNTVDEAGCKQKVYYNENVYRVSGSTHEFKEIMQTGIECIGDIALYDIYEVLSLGAMSLNEISSDFAIDVSHMGVLKSILDEASDNEVFKKEITSLISEKNSHEATALCEKYQIEEKYKNKILSLVTAYGNMADVIKKLDPVCENEQSKKALCELRALCALLEKTEFKDKIKLDFSVVNDMNYYNGIVFKGFLNGISEGVLSGGQYDTLMQRMGRKSGAVGFAIYLDLLEYLQSTKSEYDVDVLLIYSEKTDTLSLVNSINSYIEKGICVSAQKSIPAKLRYKKIVYLDKEGC